MLSCHLHTPIHIHHLNQSGEAALWLDMKTKAKKYKLDPVAARKDVNFLEAFYTSFAKVT